MPALPSSNDIAHTLTGYSLTPVSCVLLLLPFPCHFVSGGVDGSDGAIKIMAYKVPLNQTSDLISPSFVFTLLHIINWFLFLAIISISDTKGNNMKKSLKVSSPLKLRCS